MLQVSGLKKSYGSRVLFDDVSFTVAKGQVLGLVGRNGCGKSTLLKIFRGLEVQDQGDVLTPKGYRIGALDQHIQFSESSVLLECCRYLPEEHMHDYYRAEALLFGLGFSSEDLEMSPNQFSGGYQLRIQLVKALLQEPDLLLLDEPTNYLDILSLRWLRKFLKSFRGEAILITHDRLFMDSVITHTAGLHRGRLKKIEGTTEKYYQQLILEEDIYLKTKKNQEKKVAEMQQFVDRFRAKASKAKQAQSRMKALEKMSVLGDLMKESRLGFQFRYRDTPAKTLLKVEDLTFGFDPSQPLFSNLSFDVKPEECLCIVGKNGHGKTTLLNVIAKQLQGSGSIITHPETTLGYYQQTNKKKLDPTQSIFQEIHEDNPELPISYVKGICGAMMFSGEDADKKISVLSGGEQGRVLLGKVIANPCNLLLLDEPTNHLDMESISVMTEEILDFPGGALVVTHDEALLRRVATKLIVFRDGNAELFLGTYDEFLEKVGWGDEVPPKKAKSKGNQKEIRRKKAAMVRERAKFVNPVKERLAAVESEIFEIEATLEKRDAQELPQLQLDSPEAKAFFKVSGELQVTLAKLYTEYDERVSEVDTIESKYDKIIQDIESGL